MDGQEPNRPSESADLAAAMSELANLMTTTSTLHELLGELARVATGVVSPRASCGITIQQDEMPWTVASSDARAAQADEVQYGQGEGPCLETVRTGQPTVVEDLAREERWPSYRPRALGYGIRSSLSLPLTVNGDVRGALNLYSTTVTAFGQEERQAAEIFGIQASMVLTVAVRQAQQAKLTDQLREALATRAVIDQALGVVMAHEGCDRDSAFAILRQASQNQNRKLRAVAADIVEAVSGRPPGTTPFNDPS
jgi:GAF domain-containing protein